MKNICSTKQGCCIQYSRRPYVLFITPLPRHNISRAKASYYAKVNVDIATLIKYHNSIVISFFCIHIITVEKSSNYAQRRRLVTLFALYFPVRSQQTLSNRMGGAIAELFRCWTTEPKARGLNLARCCAYLLSKVIYSTWLRTDSLNVD